RPSDLPPTRPRHAAAAIDFEARTVHGAHQQAVLRLEELSRRPVQAAAGVGADVDPGADSATGAVQDDRLRLAVDGGLDLGEAAVDDGVEGDQGCGRVGDVHHTRLTKLLHVNGSGGRYWRPRIVAFPADVL